MLKLTPDQSAHLSRLYSQSSVALDRLPYTPEFDHLFTAFTVGNHLSATRSEIWHALTYLRKTRQLPRKGR